MLLFTILNQHVYVLCSEGNINGLLFWLFNLQGNTLKGFGLIEAICSVTNGSDINSSYKLADLISFTSP